MKKTLTILFLYSLGLCQAQSNPDLVKIVLNGKKADNLDLIIYLPSEKYISEGLSNDQINWGFHIPDSIYERHQHMSLQLFSNDSTISTVTLNIVPTDQNDTLKVGSYSFERNNRPLTLKYLKSDTINNDFFYRGKDYISNSFIVCNNSNTELDISAKGLSIGFSMFERASRDSLSYDGKLQEYICFVKKFPNSHFLLSMVANTLTFYKNTKDLKSIYDCFSEVNKQTYYGRRIQEYISIKTFENMSLLVSNSDNIEEPIIKDSTKYNLVIFSASWCGPCHKQIPILKKIYSDLGLSLDITYISIDEEETVSSWNKLMEKEQIPWRSLLAAKDLTKVKEKYFAQTIPHTLFIHPNGYMEIIDIRKEEDKDRLYQLVKIKEKDK